MKKFILSPWSMFVFSIALAIAIYSFLIKIIPNSEAVVVSLCLSVIIFIMGQKIAIDKEVREVKRATDKYLDDELEKRATKEYVDKGDLNTLKVLQVHIENSQELDRKTMKLIESIDKKIDKVYDKLI